MNLTLVCLTRVQAHQGAQQSSEGEETRRQEGQEGRGAEERQGESH